MERIDELVAARAAAAPGTCAIIDGDRRLSYAELLARADHEARRLSALGVAPGDRVAICLERSAELVIAELACLRLGAAYVPLAVSQPLERTRLMVEACGAQAIVRADASGTIEIEPSRVTSTPPLDGAGGRRGAAPACVMFTSGSTGMPKGVVVPHRAIVGLVTARDYAPLGSQDVVAFASNPAFDASTWETWGALANGATLVVLSRDTVVSSTRLAAAIRRYEITAMFLTTALFNHLVRSDPASLRGLHTLLFGGEACDVEMVQRACSTALVTRLVHVYGPTECTTFALFHDVGARGRDDVTEGGATVPIGQPIAGTTAHVLDDAGRLVRDDEVGELYLGGHRLALGYIGDEALTARRFVPDHIEPGEGRRLYRTGDLVRRRRDGVIDYVGRADRQVKVSGFRVQLEELEVAATAHPAVRRAVAFVRPGPDGNELALVAESDAIDEAGLRSHVRRHLPPELSPAAMAVVSAMPLNENGKIDRKTLESLFASGARLRAGVSAGIADVDPAVAAAWHRVAGSADVDPDATYFDLGIGSLQVARMLAEVARTTGVDLPLSAMLEHSTLRALSAAVVARRGRAAPAAKSDAGIIEIRPGGSSALVLVHCYEEAAFFFRPLLQHLITQRAVLVLDELRFAGRWRNKERVEDIAAACIRGWDKVRPEGAPLVLGGYSAAGGVAYEMARQLLERGTPVDGLVLFDPASSIPMYDRQLQPATPPEERRVRGWRGVIARGWRRASRWYEGFARRRLLDLRAARAVLGIRGTIEQRYQLNFDRHWMMMTRYTPPRLPRQIPVLFVACTGDRAELTLQQYLRGWGQILGGSAEVRLVDGNHSGDQSFLVDPYVAEVARLTSDFLARECRPDRDRRAEA